MNVNIVLKLPQEGSTLLSEACRVDGAWAPVLVPWGPPSPLRRQSYLVLGPCSLHHCLPPTSAHTHTHGRSSHTGSMFSASLPASDIYTHTHMACPSSHTGSMFSASLPASDICTHTHMAGPVIPGPCSLRHCLPPTSTHTHTWHVQSYRVHVFCVTACLRHLHTHTWHV